MLNFMNINRDPDAEKPGGGELNPIEDALNNQLGEETPPVETPAPDGTPKPEEKPIEKPAENPDEGMVEVDGKKIKDRRSKAFEERRKDALESRNHVDLDFDYGQGDKASRKVALDEVKKTLRWLQDNSQTIAAGLSMNKFSAQYPQFGKVIESVIKGSFNDKNEFNPVFAERVLKAVEAKEEHLEEQADEVDSEIAKIQKILDDEDIDPESAQGEALMSSMRSLKAMKGQLGKALKQLDDATKSIGDVKKGQEEFTTNRQKQEHTAEVKRIGDLFDTEIRALTDKEKKDGYKFEIDQESIEFDSMVRAGVRKTVADLNLKDGEKFTDEQFVKIIRDNAKAAYEEITKKREAIVNAYIKRKGLTPIKKQDEELPPPEGDMDLESLSKTVEDLLPK